MEHWITGISTHCAASDNATIHWLTVTCSCGQVFTETSPSKSYRTAATGLSRKAVKHVTEENHLSGVPRVTDA